MNRDYSEAKIREALKLSGGSAARARQQVIAWAFDDPKLMHELIAPHMTGIVAHAISHVANAKARPVAPPPVPAAAKKGKGEKDAFGMEILKAIALGNPAQFGLETGNATSGKQAASQRHVDAIRAMVSKKKTD